MQRSTLWLLLAVLFVTACQQDDSLNDFQLAVSFEVLDRATVNQTLYAEAEEKGLIHWSRIDPQTQWSAAMNGDSIFAVGYEIPGGAPMSEIIHTIDIESSEWVAQRDELLAQMLESERKLNPALAVVDLLPQGMPRTLPTMGVRLVNPATMMMLRDMAAVRYVEPKGYELPPLSLEMRSGSGCGNATPNYSINGNDFTTIAPFTKQSWHQASSNVSQAWGTTTGSGVTITIIDTGTSDNQDNLGSQFNSGWSSGRFVQKYSTKYSGWWWWRSLDPPHDQCGHGTQMAGLATAPRGTDGNSVGIAYNANLIGIRAVEDVVISNSDESDGVKDALVLAGNRNDVKVISMSIGTPFSNSTVADGVYFAYNKGKMICAAAGTSLSWTSWYPVIFPATMSQTVAVTGVRDGSSMQKCNTCHDGPEVDFVMVMQRASNTSRTAITLSTSSNQPNYVGGSSAATASVAGIAGLIYASHPGASRAQVFNLMKQNASYYPSKNNNLGWGIINAQAAVQAPL
ncbi:MAG: S8 family serine peptidase [Bacteroidota bacterium]